MHPSMSVSDKAAKAAMVEWLFDTTSWTKVQSLSIERLKNGREKVRYVRATGRVPATHHDWAEAEVAVWSGMEGDDLRAAFRKTALAAGILPPALEVEQVDSETAARLIGYCRVHEQLSWIDEVGETESGDALFEKEAADV
jgi:hypothetical protein